MPDATNLTTERKLRKTIDRDLWVEARITVLREDWKRFKSRAAAKDMFTSELLRTLIREFLSAGKAEKPDRASES